MQRVLAVGAVIGAVSVALCTPAFAETDATTRDFWRGAATLAPYTVYAPPSAALKAAGLDRQADSKAMRMQCRGVWNTDVAFVGDGDRSLSIYQAPSVDCWPDWGAGQQVETSTFRAHGRRFEIHYEGCPGKDSEASETAPADCPPSQTLYHVDGKLPAADGEAATWLHAETVGVTPSQIRQLVRSMAVVS